MKNAAAAAVAWAVNQQLQEQQQHNGKNNNKTDDENTFLFNIIRKLSSRNPTDRREWFVREKIKIKIRKLNK